MHRLGCQSQRLLKAPGVAGIVIPAYVLFFFVALASLSLNAQASEPPPPPPPPPSLAGVVKVSMIVEMPSGQKYHADVTDADCPHQNQCDYYGIYGYARAGFKKMDLVVRERCTGPHGSESCAIIAINGISNSAKGRWTLYRDGHRNAYPYNQITRETVPERLVFKFLSNT